MKIILQDGETIDTAKLSDKESEINEASANLHNVCKKYNATCITVAVLNDKKYVLTKARCQHPEDKKVVEEYNTLFSGINRFLIEATNGRVHLCSEDNLNSP